MHVAEPRSTARTRLRPSVHQCTVSNSTFGAEDSGEITKGVPVWSPLSLRRLDTAPDVWRAGMEVTAQPVWRATALRRAAGAIVLAFFLSRNPRSNPGWNLVCLLVGASPGSKPKATSLVCGRLVSGGACMGSSHGQGRSGGSDLAGSDIPAASPGQARKDVITLLHTRVWLGAAAVYDADVLSVLGTVLVRAAAAAAL